MVLTFLLNFYSALRAKALAVRPESKPNTITVAIFREPTNNEDVKIDDLGDEDFLWLRCSAVGTPLELSVFYG